MSTRATVSRPPAVHFRNALCTFLHDAGLLCGALTLLPLFSSWLSPALASGSEINLSSDRINNYQPLPSVGKIGRLRSRSPERLKRPSLGPLSMPLGPIGRDLPDSKLTATAGQCLFHLHALVTPLTSSFISSLNIIFSGGTPAVGRFRAARVTHALQHSRGRL